MTGIIFFFILLTSTLTQEDDLDALLLYEDPSVLQVQDQGWNTPNVNALTLKRQIHQDIKEFIDFTLCFRMNVLYFTNNRESTPMNLRTDKIVEIRNPDTGAKFFWANHIMLLFSNLGASMWMNTFSEFLSEVIAENGVYSVCPVYEGGCLNANQWHSICLGFDAKKRFIYFVQNGETLVNTSQPKIWAEKNRGYDTTMIGPVKLHFEEENFDKGIHWAYHYWSGFMIGPNTQPFTGYLTDIQIFGKSLTTEEMHDITSCKLFKQGDIYSWDADDWEPLDKELQKNESTAVQYRTVKVPKKSLCKAAEKYTFFPDPYPFSDGVNLCRRFGGKPIDVSTSAKANAVAMFLGKNIVENPKYDATIRGLYSMYNDEKEFNVWRHYQTDELPTDPIAWDIGEPNGGMKENCAAL